MRIYFDYLGDNFDGYGIEDVAFDFIQFKSGDEEYVFDTTGDLDINFGKTIISGRFKGECRCDQPIGNNNLSNEEIEKIIMNMDQSTFKIGLFDEGNEPNWKKLKVDINVGTKHAEFEVNKAA